MTRRRPGDGWIQRILGLRAVPATRRNLQINAAQKGTTTLCGFTQTLESRLRSRQLCFEQLAGLLLHGMSVLGGADAKPALGIFGELANCDAGHAINDITDGIDCIVGSGFRASGFGFSA
jgi:hypothetical protein